jgi:hypothetical protein
MTRLLLPLAVLLTACAPAPEPVHVQKDPTTEPWYADTLKQLADMNTRANKLFEGGKPDDASALILQAEPLSTKLLAVPQPTLAAMAAAADLDELYGRMLMSNHNYGWARMFFQKNLARWKHWTPQTPDTTARVQQAEKEIADCDRHIEGP